MSELDLEEPGIKLVTMSGLEARVVGTIGEGECPYVVHVKGRRYPRLLYSNRNGTKTVTTSTFQPSLTTLQRF